MTSPIADEAFQILNRQIIDMAKFKKYTLHHVKYKITLGPCQLRQERIPSAENHKYGQVNKHKVLNNGSELVVP